MLQSIKTIMQQQWQCLFGATGSCVSHSEPFETEADSAQRSTGIHLVQSYQSLEAGGAASSSAETLAATPQDLAGLSAFFEDHGLVMEAPKFPKVNPLTCQTINWAEEIRQETLDSLQRSSAREAKAQALSSNTHINRLAHLLRLALCSGNINLAMMIFGHLEARNANEVTRGLMEKVQKLQDRKRQFSQEIQNQKDDAEGSKNLQKIKTDMEQANDDISVLQTFIRDVAQNKQQSLELANAFISKEHETAMTILRSWSR